MQSIVDKNEKKTKTNAKHKGKQEIETNAKSIRNDD